MLYISIFNVFLEHSIIMSIIYENIMAIIVNEKTSKLRKLIFDDILNIESLILIVSKMCSRLFMKIIEGGIIYAIWTKP